jgi:hypothetical protein
LAWLLVLCGCGPADAEQPLLDRAPGPGRVTAPGVPMPERLSAYAASVNPAGNMYLNRARAAQYLQQVEAARRAGRKAILPRLSLAYERMLAGDTEAAIDGFVAVRADLEALGARANPATLADLRRMLALAWLRLGEQENCAAHLGTETCLFPIGPKGVHVEQRGSRMAKLELLDALAEDGEDYEARWLLTIAAMTLGEYPEGVPEAYRIPAELFDSPHDVERFQDVARAADASPVGLAGGVCMEDFDGDGLLDLMVSSWGLSDPLRLLRARGDGRFEDVSVSAGLAGLVGGLNLIHADYDNDGDVDVFVLRGGWFEQGGAIPNSLLANDGTGHFTDVTEAAGMLSFHPTQTAAWGDYDGDGWLDLFVGNESGPKEDHPCELFRNNGDGTFTECAAQLGVAHEGYVKGVSWGDFDNDDRPDLYVTCIDGDNVLFHNGGPGIEPLDIGEYGVVVQPWSFLDVALQAGVTKPLRAFPTWFWDYDNDGWLDLFVSGFRFGSAGWVAQDYLGLPNKGVLPKLYRNRGDGTFEDTTSAAGVEKVLLTMGCNYGDLDNDGWPDFYVATGEPDLAALYPNRMFRNAGDGSFQDVTTSGGFGHLQKGHGVAFGDLDNDGDQDIYAVLGGAYEGDVFGNALFLNPGHGRRWLTLRLVGVMSNRSAIGTRITVRITEPGGEREVHALVGSGGSFGGNSLQQEIGLGTATAIRELLVHWPATGITQRWTNVGLDQVLIVREDFDELVLVEPPRVTLGGG